MSFSLKLRPELIRKISEIRRLVMRLVKSRMNHEITEIRTFQLVTCELRSEIHEIDL